MRGTSSIQLPEGDTSVPDDGVWGDHNPLLDNDVTRGLAVIGGALGGLSAARALTEPLAAAIPQPEVVPLLGEQLSQTALNDWIMADEAAALAEAVPLLL